MPWSITFTGEDDDKETLKIITHNIDMYCAITEALSKIRSRIKYGEDVSDAEEKCLEEIRSELLVTGLDL